MATATLQYGASAPKTELRRAGGYTRLSREDGDKEESDSIGNQKEQISSFIKGRTDIVLAETYEDDGYTGVNYERPGFKRLITDIKSGKINCVIVKDLSRLGRNYIETGKLLERFFPFMGVRFIAINDSYDSQNHNAQTDNLIIPFKNLINDAYCADISKKIRSQFEVRRKKGEFIGSFAAYGYAKDPVCKNRLIIEEDTASVVCDIFKWKIAGMSHQGIADKLNSMGILSPFEHKKASGSKYITVFNVNTRAQWTPVAVGRILKNDLYIGALTQGISTTPNYKVKQRIQKPENEWVRVEQAHNAIISPEDFGLVARLLEQDTRIAPGGDAVYLFSGFIYCGDCGRPLCRKPVKNSEYAYFICSTYKKDKSCQSHSISEKLIYDTVFQTLTLQIEQSVEIARLLSFIEDIPQHRAETLKLQKQIAQKKSEIEKINSRKLRLYEDYADGVMNRNEYTRFKSIFETHCSEAESAIFNLQEELDQALSDGGAKQQWIEHFQKYQDMQCLTRSAVADLIERITIYNDKRLKIKIRYQDDVENAASYLESLPESILGKAVV